MADTLPPEPRPPVTVDLWTVYLGYLRTTKQSEADAEYPAEAFLCWVAEQLGVKVVALLGDDRQYELVRARDPVALLNWPNPHGENPNV